MKRLLVGDNRENLLATLETILRHWGYRTLVSSNQQRLTSLVQETTPDLLVFGENILRDPTSPLRKVVLDKAVGGTPLLIMNEHAEPLPLEVPHEALPVPVDIFTLFEKVQRYLEKYPRKNIRLALQLPGMLCLGNSCHLAEVLSLSTRGLFIKTGFRLQKGDSFRIVFPLLGMKRELEMGGRVLYCVRPDPDNNFLQGVGVEFTDISQETQQALQGFLEGCLLDELPGQAGAKLLAENRPNSRSEKPTLHLINPAA
ncbi:MAG: PilZ domain-containing protein [Syntrophotaleaceae bacterium]